MVAKCCLLTSFIWKWNLMIDKTEAQNFLGKLKDMEYCIHVVSFQPLTSHSDRQVIQTGNDL